MKNSRVRSNHVVQKIIQGPGLYSSLKTRSNVVAQHCVCKKYIDNPDSYSFQNGYQKTAASDCPFVPCIGGYPPSGRPDRREVHCPKPMRLENDVPRMHPNAVLRLVLPTRTYKKPQPMRFLTWHLTFRWTSMVIAHGASNWPARVR